MVDMEQKDPEPLKIEFEPFYWNQYQSCLSKAVFGGLGIMFGVSSGICLAHELTKDRLPRYLQKWRLFPVFLIAGGTATLFARYTSRKCREEFFYLERKRAGAEVFPQELPK